MSDGPNLFTRLHKWATRQDENFLTEALAVVLEHLLLLAPECGVRSLARLTDDFLDMEAADASTVEIHTQVIVGTARLDLELAAPQRLVWIEVKVESALRIGQLEGYRVLLAAATAEQKRLGLLTRYPEVFNSQDDSSDFTIHWFELADWLERELPAIEAANTVAWFVTRQFLGFLEARNMTLTQVGPYMPDGVRALASLLNMLMEAVAACKVTATKNAGWDYIGLKVDGKFWVGIYITDPDKLHFLTNCKIQREAAVKLGVGDVSEESWIPGRSRWRRTAELASEDIHFFARTKVSQMQWLQKFVAESLGMARAIVSPDQPAATEIATAPQIVEPVPLDD
jgi:hypothetical protein